MVTWEERFFGLTVRKQKDQSCRRHEACGYRPRGHVKRETLFARSRPPETRYSGVNTIGRKSFCHSSLILRPNRFFIFYFLFYFLPRENSIFNSLGRDEPPLSVFRLTKFLRIKNIFVLRKKYVISLLYEIQSGSHSFRDVSRDFYLFHRK